MIVQDRYSALQNENVRLYRIFEYDGNLLQLPEVPTVTIINSDGVGTLDTVTAVMESPGIYYADYFVPIDLPVGRYYDKWTFRYTTDDPYKEEITHFEVHPKDAILNFSSSEVSQKFTDIMERGIRDLANYFIYEPMHLPVYGEQALRTGDGTRYNFAYKNWNKDPKPIVRVNNRIVDEGWYADYNGNIFFENSLAESDVVHAHYKFAYFSKEDLAGFLDVGLNAMNAIPPASANYPTLSLVPIEWWHGIQLYASIQALRRLLLGLSFQETAIIYGSPDTAGGGANAARDAITSLYNDYSALWKEMAAGIKKKLPNVGQIVIPSYTLPGGRARWFRYLYVSGV